MCNQGHHKIFLVATSPICDPFALHEESIINQLVGAVGRYIDLQAPLSSSRRRSVAYCAIVNGKLDHSAVNCFQF
jgi:hypothetical protein